VVRHGVRRTYGRIRSAAWRTSAAWSWMKLVKPRGVAVGRGLAVAGRGRLVKHGACEDDGHADDNWEAQSLT